ncbi:MAG: hypothetical protein AAGH72_09520 [Verrucomicrobiota bacterium]
MTGVDFKEMQENTEKEGIYLQEMSLIDICLAALKDAVSKKSGLVIQPAVVGGLVGFALDGVAIHSDKADSVLYSGVKL